MSRHPLRVGVHVADTKRGQTLGVAHFAANMIVALGERPDVEVVVIGSRETTAEFGIEQTADPIDEPAIIVDVAVQIHQFLERVVDAPTVAIVHDLHLFTVGWKYRTSAARLRRLLEENLRSQVVASEFPGTVDAVKHRYPEVADRCRLLPSPTLLSDVPLTDEARIRVRERYRLDEAVPTLLYPAQLQAHKNHWNLIAAIAELRDAGTPVRVICTGSTFQEHLTTSLEMRVRQLGLGALIDFSGYVSGEDLRGLYAEVDGVISPSLAEGGAYLAQEAIVHGQPVTCSDLPSARAHLARLEVEVPLFDPFDVGAVAAAISTIVNGGEKIVAGYERALELEAGWTWDVVASEITDLARLVRG